MKALQVAIILRISRMINQAITVYIYFILLHALLYFNIYHLTILTIPVERPRLYCASIQVEWRITELAGGR